MGARTVQITAHDGLVNIDITIPDLEIEPAIGIGADPGFIVNVGSLATKIR